MALKGEYDMQCIGVLGAGAWGTAIAQHLAMRGHLVTMWSLEPDVAESIKNNHTNRFLPDVILDKKISATSSLETFFNTVDLIFEAVPVRYLEAVLNNAKAYIKPTHEWVIMSKGVYQGLLLDDIFNTFSDISLDYRAVLSGPNFAREVARGYYSETMIAGANHEFVQKIKALFESDTFFVVTSNDYRGVQAASAYKNLVALAVGIARGAGFHENACAALMTQGLAEVEVIIKFFGGQAATVYSLAGAGDLILTSAGSQSRNVSFGFKIGQGESIESLVAQGIERSEGVATAESLVRPEFAFLALPVSRRVCQILFEGLSPQALFPLSR